MADKNVHGGHRKRLRDRAMSEGLEAFNPHQVLELLLFYAIPRQDTSEIAHLLIDRFGSVHDVLNAPAAELTQVPGVGKKTAEWLVDLGTLVRTYGELRAEDRPKMVNFQTAMWFCEDARNRCEPQTVYALCTAPSGVVQVFVKICDSLAWGEPEVLRHCLEEALSVKARSVIVVEFIDGDRPRVEEYHRQCAEKYACTMSYVGAELLDVILVGRTEVLSTKPAIMIERSTARPSRFSRRTICARMPRLQTARMNSRLWIAVCDPRAHFIKNALQKSPFRV